MTSMPADRSTNAPMTTFSGLAKPDRGPKWASLLLLITLTVLIVTLICWARIFTLEIWASGPGRVTPAQQLQVVQNLEGGIVREVLVKEGDRARSGDVIARIDATEAEGSYQEDQINWFALLGLIDRLQAEAVGEALSFSTALRNGGPEADKVMAIEQTAFKARQEGLQSSLKVFATQKESELQTANDAREQIKLLRNTRDLIQRQLDVVGPQVRKGLVSETELLKIERERATVEQQNSELEAAVNAALRNADQLEAKIEEKVGMFRAEAVAQLSERRATLAALSERLVVSRDRFTRREIRAPVDGVVKRVLTTTPGEIIKPGDTLIEIVPTEDDLLVEVRITPQDIGFIRSKQPARVRLTAYDSSIYGVMQGEVVRVGADTLLTKDEESFYTVVVKVDRFADSNGQPLDIIAGMTADVSIVTGERSILDYVFKPITKLRLSALRDR